MLVSYFPVSNRRRLSGKCCQTKRVGKSFYELGTVQWLFICIFKHPQTLTESLTSFNPRCAIVVHNK